MWHCQTHTSQIVAPWHATSGQSIINITNQNDMLQNASNDIKALKIEVAESEEKRQQAEVSLAELEKKKTGVQEALTDVEAELAAEKKRTQDAQNALITAEATRQLAQNALADANRLHQQTVQVSVRQLNQVPRSHCHVTSQA